MHWGLNRDELPSIRDWHPNVAEVREIPFHGGRGAAYRVALPILLRTPWVGDRLFTLVHVRCQRVAAIGDECVATARQRPPRRA
jgi:hypothetical protein